MLFRIISLAVLALSASVSRAAEPSGELMEFFEEEAKVVTASRRLEFVREAPVAVEIITADDIRRSGAVNLWDFMRFRVGMNVIDARSGDGNRAAVSVRGFPAEFVDKLLVLVDGRSVYNGLSGGTVWEDLPLQVQDIERIEIIRGPNAALYGSNAGLGVINILTKKPQEPLSLFTDALWGNRGMHREQASLEQGNRRGAYRLSFAHKALEGHPLTAGPRGNDFLYSNKANFRGYWDLSEKSTLELFSGGSWETLGLLDSAVPWSQGRFRNDFEMLKYAYAAHKNSSIQAMASRRDDLRVFDPNFVGVLAAREYQYDAEILHQLGWRDGRAHTTYGGSFRHVSVDSAGIFPGKPRQENSIGRGFLSQSFSVSPRLNLTGAASIERSDTGGTEPAYQLAAVATPLPEHTFRASYGSAPTIPTLYNKSASQRASATVLLVGNPNMTAQRLRSYEVSYQGSFLDNRLLIENNLFYMTVGKLARTIVQSYVFPLLTLSFDNSNRAVVRGAEFKASYKWDAGRSVYANYTHETVSDGKADINVSRGTPAHKVNLGAVMALGLGFSAAANAGYQDGHRLYSQATGQALDVGAYWRMDARLAYALASCGAEIYIAGQNLLRPTHVEFPEGLAVPRTYLAGISLKFGK